MRDIVQILHAKLAWGRNKTFLGLPLFDVAVLALPIVACALLLVSFVARYAEYFPSKLAHDPAPFLVSASLPITQANLDAGGAPVVGTPYLRPSFGFGAFSAETDKLPNGASITPVPLMEAPTTLALLPSPTTSLVEGIQRPNPQAVPDAASDLVASSMVAVPVLDASEFSILRPIARPDLQGASLASLTPTPEIDGATAGQTPENLLETYAVLMSPRPAYRPARLLSAERAVAAVSAVPTPAPEAAPAAAPTPQLASLRTQPNGGLFSGPSGQSCSRRLARAIPRRSGRAQTGSSFIASLASTSGGSRDAAIAREAMTGNVPKFLRNLVPVTFTGRLGNGRETTITICVTPDYLAIGSDADYVRVPMGLGAAGQIADQFNMMLPTTRMVDAIYAQAAVRLSPQPMQAGSQMSSTPYFLRHNATVEGQRRAAGGRLGILVSGHKKDLVLTNRLASAPGRVAIYGWHRTNGRPIQPLSTVHGAGYADYSHGIRLISQTAYVDGRAANLQELLQDRQYAQMLNDGGIIGRPAIRIAGL